MLLAVSCLLSFIGDLVTEDINGTTNNSTNLEETIRRQLMTNNYDYLPSDSEDSFPIVRRARDDTDYLEESATYQDSIVKSKNNTNDNKLDRNDVFIPRAQNVDDDKKLQNDDSVSKNDLLYYIDDEKLRKEPEADGYKISDISFHNDIYYDNNSTEEPTSTKAKFKMLKVKDTHQSRRSLSFRRFIKEQSADGIALTNLDEQPFPQFRLPPERRQYMHDDQDNDNNDSVHGEATSLASYKY